MPKKGNLGKGRTVGEHFWHSTKRRCVKVEQALHKRIYAGTVKEYPDTITVKIERERVNSLPTLTSCAALVK